ncbi:hypothetical protein BV133_3345 [Blastochloris viridis]|uniref:Uncharacterized protein n=1 Tax=Blastochloris viridis TaxID=1079 RepID=A0A182D6I0_BLAVI|nr:hypothetical protein BV133_3345 [Blastochloris viridis]
MIAGVAAALALGITAGPSSASAEDSEFQLAQYWGDPPPRRWGPPPPRRWGRACYTTRGTCGLEERVPRGAPCRCFFPGGPKRGNVI